MSLDQLKILLISMGVFLGGWYLVVWLTEVPPFILPGPERVFRAAVHNWELILEHATVTISEVLLGLLIGSLLGVATAYQLMVSRVARRYLQPLLVFSQTVPVFALAPILTLWLGYGMGSKIAMAVLIICFPVTSTFFDGLKNTPSGFLDLANSMNASATRILFLVRTPAAIPSLASGMKLAAVYAPIGAVIGEWVGASKGLGYLMLLANGRVKIDLLFASLFSLALFTIALHGVISWSAHRLSRRYS